MRALLDNTYFTDTEYCTKVMGQVFTPSSITDLMVGLIGNKGSILEPSAGEGAFLSVLPLQDTDAIELNPVLYDRIRLLYPGVNSFCGDFFALTTNKKYSTIIGNPPYVRYQDTLPSTKKHLSLSLFDKRTNLYLFFIERSIRLLERKGELIFITPRDLLQLTCAKRLRWFMGAEGAITYWKDLGDERVFLDATPNCAVWRFEKGKKKSVLSFERPKERLGDYFYVKVGAVSGADDIFTNDKHANAQFVCSKTRKDGYLRAMIYNTLHPFLHNYKEELLKRRIKRFDESNWWRWGRACPIIEGERIYVNTKTRQKDPFFVSSEKYFDGSILALFPKKKVNLQRSVRKLNSIDWEAKGFVCDNRYLFSQHSLSNCGITEPIF